MKSKSIISGLIIWTICLTIRIFYLSLLNDSNITFNYLIFGFKLSLFFFSPFLLIIIIMQYLEFKYITLRKNNFIYAMLCFGLLGILYFSLAYNNKTNYNFEVILESIYSLIAGFIYYIFNYCNRKKQDYMLK